MILLAAAIFGVFGKVSSETGTAGEQPSTVQSSATRTLMTVVVGLAIWLLPLLGMALLAGQTVLPELAQFFAKLAVVTFGGAYAVLAYMGQEVVTHHHWLSTPEMMDGLGLAETTPGPLILVTEFVGFIAAYRDALVASGGAAISTSPVIFGCVGALVTLWATFAPCFLWIFSAGPYCEWIVARPRLNNALGGITAAIVGVIANLSAWFALHVFFAKVELVEKGMFQILIPDPASVEWGVLPIAFVCGLLLLWRQWDEVGRSLPSPRRWGLASATSDPQKNDDSDLPLWPRFAITAPANRQQIQPAIVMSREPRHDHSPRAIIRVRQNRAGGFRPLP